MKEVLEKRPGQPLRLAIKGMIPKNRLREDILDRRLFIYPGAFHPHFKQGLPQFTVPAPNDINEEFDFGKVQERRHNYKVVYESNPENLPEEFADVERDINTDIDIPDVLREKTHTNPKDNIKMMKLRMKSYKAFARYKKHKI